jgi:hypothetical protein
MVVLGMVVLGTVGVSTAAFILKVREESKPSLLALLERGRED